MATDIKAVHNLLDKLASDDDVRSEFEKDPIGVFEKHGLPRPTASIPSKEDIQANMDKYRAAAEKDISFMIIFMAK